MGPRRHPDTELRQLLAEVNATRVDFDTARPVHELIEARAGRDPSRTAVACGERALTHVELDAKANRIAGYLVDQGVGAESFVAVCIDRSVDLIAGILGILKAGAAYVPLDPAYPMGRIEYMLADCEAPVLLTQTHLLPNLPSHSAATVCLDDPEEPLFRRDAGPLGVAIDPDQLAYMIYTSGSSGKPKGVMVSHRNLTQSTLARTHYYAEPIERFLLLASCSFDSSVAGIFWSLSEGQTLVLPEEGEQQDGHAIAELIARHRITHMLSLPALYELVLDRGESGVALDSLRTVVLHGEVFSGKLTSRHYRHLPACRLYNEYGPTEDSVWSTVEEIDSDIETGQISIGGPIPNTTVFVVDDLLRLVEPGEPGELVLGGAGVTRGYRGRPDLTADRFVPDPFGDEPGGRLYRTGDKVRFLDDGRLEFLGRVDDQVKIRGYRIEPVEIEIALAEHSDVRQVVVVPRRPASGALQLVAYVVPEASPTPGVGELRHFLQQRLPEFMLPSIFVFLPALPQMPNGKIDKQALPDPDRMRPDLEQEYVAPSSDLERLVAEEWSRVLGVEMIGARDNFFELGGDSIQAAIAINRVRDRVGEGVNLAMLFTHPTVRGLAESITASAEEPVRGSIGSPTSQRSVTAEAVAELTDEEVSRVLDEVLEAESTQS